MALEKSNHAKKLSALEQQYKDKVARIVSYNPHINKNLFDYGVKFIQFQKLILAELEKAYLFAFSINNKETEIAITKRLSEIEVISSKLDENLQDLLSKNVKTVNNVPQVNVSFFG